MNANFAQAVEIACVRVSTALGEFVVEASARGVRAVTPVAGHARSRATVAGPRPQDAARNAFAGMEHPEALAHVRAAATALQRHAAGEPVRFEGAFDLGAPALRLAVWERLRAIPFGATATYGEIAQAVGQPGEARAIGAMVGANPICILIPCHRVVGADGSLRGFAWGLDLKRRLLAHEGNAALPLFAEALR